ncbi:TetR/AcrR family transcriptional regulator [Acinetobacter rathckeae]|uniref:TetR/AcrR family transcriptional regulator n=1 Tax=Acinetobacter rathckeae TaxID=2605272 RepID=UPI0018A2C036|nr:TetR/AcrR family transcriptional regulator [Acinetobacter rathckeae]MBF7695559.1 TetR/AcrR family transcriptional regulator [Acinetobacter rathckeae]
MLKKKTSKTKQRILDTSLMLFNEQGERAVTTNHIAAALQMSPGNLYYHYSNKQEIIKALTEQYQQQTLAMLALPNDRTVTANDKITYFKALSEQLWAYRFLHRDVYDLVEKDQHFNQEYAQFASNVMREVQKLYQAFIHAGLMKMSATEMEALIINIWIILTNWTNFLFMSGHLNGSNHSQGKWSLFALRQLVLLESPYLIGESKQTYERLLASMEDSNLFAKVTQSV